MTSCLLINIAVILLGVDIIMALPPVEENIPPRPRNGHVQTQYCAYYNGTYPPPCEPGNNSMCNTPATVKEECRPVEQDKSSHCFVLWDYDNITNTGKIRFMGCFLETVTCSDKASPCRIHKYKSHLLHCCCEGDMCNENMPFPGIHVVPEVSTESPTDTIQATIFPSNEDDSSAIIAYTVTPIFLLLAALVASYFLYRKRKGSSFSELAAGEASLSRPPSAGEFGENEMLGLVNQITLCEIRARGRFGAVWRAKLGQNNVAVKIFPLQDKQSWLAEQEIYRLPRLEHPDILHYIGVDKKGDNLQAEYWLVTAFHEKGSLSDYLKAHTLSWAEAWRISTCVARGLAHLHEEGGGKPAVAHRDFKSKNVLLKDDLSACIADFGLALIFISGRGCGDTHGQVGTRRYMAPEVLDGAINFTKDAFLRIDMYACALVLWEIASRCNEGGLEPTAQYRLPLEEEVGSHPSLEEMQEVVVQRKTRPHIPPRWKEHPGLAMLCDTIEECWDHDAEARLSASCVHERVVSLRPNPSPVTPSAPKSPLTPDTTPLLIHEIAEQQQC